MTFSPIGACGTPRAAPLGHRHPAAETPMHPRAIGCRAPGCGSPPGRRCSGRRPAPPTVARRASRRRGNSWRSRTACRSRWSRCCARLAVAVDRQAQVHAGQELRIAERAGPAADQRRARDAGVGDLEHGDQLAFEQRPPAPFPRQGRERARQVEIATVGAVAALMPADGDGDRQRHAITGLIVAASGRSRA